MFEAGALAHFTGAYPDHPATMDHDLVGHPLLSLPRLTVLAGSIPRYDVSLRPADLDIDQYDEQIPLEDLSPAALTQGLAVGRTLIQLCDIGEERDYKAMGLDILRPLRPLLKASGERAIAPQTHIHLAPPKAKLPFHLETIHRLYLQVRGSATVHLFDSRDPKIVSGPTWERAYKEGRISLPYSEKLSDAATLYDLNEGTALYLPPGTPNWIQHGADVSIGLCLRWQSPISLEMAACYGMHSILREKGLAQRPTKGGWRQRLKAQGYAWLNQNKGRNSPTV
ncbi:MAG: hypothetical protein AAF986_00320 [Pseudomonadota bacterium]